MVWYNNSPLYCKQAPGFAGGLFASKGYFDFVS